MAEEKIIRYVQNRPPIPRPPSLTLGDIYYVLFRQKWKIIFFSALGVLAAVAVFSLKPPPYESEAKLLIRYVMDSKSLSPAATDSQVRSPDERGDNIISTEVEILTSFDLAQQVVDAVGVEKFLPKTAGGKDRSKAATLVSKNLTVEVPKNSSVIRIVFQYPDSEVVQPVLSQLIEKYLRKHVDIHQAVGVFDDFLKHQMEQLRSQLGQTEQELQKARERAGVLSLTDTKKVYTDQISKIRQELFDAEAELAERQAALKDITRLSPALSDATSSNTASAAVETSRGAVSAYKSLCGRLDLLWRKQQELLTQFTEENVLVKEVRKQIAEAETLKKKLEEENPRLASVNSTTPAVAGQPGGAAVDASTELARVAVLESKIHVLNSQLDQIRTEAVGAATSEAAIQELQRQKDLEEANYRHFSASLEQSRFDEALGAGKVSNISVIQAPSPPLRAKSSTYKMMALAILFGVCVGLGLAFVTELKFDQSVKRPVDIEAKLRLPLFLSIPYVTEKKPRHGDQGVRKKALLAKPANVAAATAGVSGPSGMADQLEVIPWEGVSGLRPFYETLRDRLIAHFEAKNLTHKPKLIAVTSPNLGSGVTTTAAGLAASLSETGDGNVLLVDMNPQQGAAQQFYQGKPICRLDDALYEKQSALVQDNLYVAAVGTNGDKLVGALPKQFSQLMPKLKVSNYDYIIFDMPPVSQTSVTPRLARFMDMVLLIIESEQTNQRVAQQASALLADSKTSVCAVLNKTRAYVPRQLSQEFLSDI